MRRQRWSDDDWDAFWLGIDRGLRLAVVGAAVLDLLVALAWLGQATS